MTGHVSRMSKAIPHDPGAALRRLRESRGLNGKTLAIEAGMSQGHLSELETGKRQLTEALTARLATALGMTPDEFLARLNEISLDTASREDALRDSVVQSPVTPYRIGKPESEALPPDGDAWLLARHFVADLERQNAFDLVHHFTRQAAAGDTSAFRKARALLAILSSSEGA